VCGAVSFLSKSVHFICMQSLCPAGPCRRHGAGQRRRGGATSRRQLQRLMHRGNRHHQLAGNGPQAKTLSLELFDFGGPSVDGRRTTEFHATRFGGGDSSVHALFDNAALKFCDRHQHIQLETTGWTIGTCVDALTAGDEGHIQPIQFV